MNDDNQWSTWWKNGCKGYDPTTIQLFLVTKILIILHIALPELATNTLLNINIDYICNDVNNNQYQSIDVTWIVFTSVALILLQFFMRPTIHKSVLPHKSLGYLIFCIVSTVFYFFVNINIINYHCGRASEWIALILISGLFEIIVIYVVMSNDFKQSFKELNSRDHHNII